MLLVGLIEAGLLAAGLLFLVGFRSLKARRPPGGRIWARRSVENG
jgi:hypothetical protein